MIRNLAGIALVTWLSSLSSPAFAEDGGATSIADPRFRVEAQFEWLPGGVGVRSYFNLSSEMALADAYAFAGFFDFALTPHLSIGVAPRLVFNVGFNSPYEVKDKELDLRARIRGHYALSPGVDGYASFALGYVTLLSDSEDSRASDGFSIGGALGFTYDLSSQLFVGGEIGYQRSFTRTPASLTDENALVFDLDLSYVHLGMGAGLRF